VVEVIYNPGRVLLQNSIVPHCEILKLDIQFIDKYKLMQQEYSKITYKSLSNEYTIVLRTGYNVDDFESENHGIKWCENNPRSDFKKFIFY